MAETLGDIIQEAVGKALADAVARLASQAPSRAEFQSLKNDVDTKSLQAAIAALGSNGPLAAMGGNLVIDFAQGTADSYALSTPFRVAVSDGAVTVTAGRRCAVGATPEWQEVNAASFTRNESDDCVVFMRWVYSVANDDGEIETPGYWEGSAPKYEPASSVPENSNTGFTVRIASVSVDGVVQQEHFGNVTVIDMAECGGGG